MSLDVLAQNLASKGRNGDSMLVHMTPGEVHGLHALALAHGGQLTINPDTGLPEANFLKKLLPMIAGAALNFFAPGIGTAIGGALGLGGAAGSAIAVGGITGLATGSLQKGLMAGLGAYGGAGLAEGLAGAGSSAAGAASIEAAQKMALEKGLTDEAANRFVQDEVAKSVAGYGAKPFMEQMAGGVNALGSPMAAAKALAGPAMYAAAPIMADAMVPTTTGMPSTKPGDTGYVRPFVYDAASFGQGPQGLQALPPVPANQINYPAPPPTGANGGLVALARGGTTSVPEVGSPERATFEQRLAAQMSPEEFEQSRTNPNSVLSPTFSADLAANLQGQKALAAQGLQSVFGGSFTGLSGAYHHGIQNPSSPTDAVTQYLNALTVEKPMGGGMAGQQDLNVLLRDYVGTALTNPNSAADTLARMRALGFDPYAPNQAGILETIDPEFLDKMYYKYSDPNRENKSAVDPNQILYNRMVAGERNPWEAAPAPLAVPRTRGAEPAPAPTPESQTPATDYITGGVGALPQAPGQGAVAPAPTPAAPEATGIGTLIPGTTAGTTAGTGTGTTITPGTQTGGGVETSRTPTTPTFMLPPGEQIFKTPVGTITGGTVTGAIDTKEALREYERTAPTGKPPAITSTGTFGGLKGTDKTYGGVEKPYAFPTQAQLGTAGAASRGTETMADVRKGVGNIYDATPTTFTPSVTGASKSAYDYLMGKGEYPIQQTLPGGAPLWKPYVQGATGAAPSAFVPATAAPTAQFGFKPVTGTTPTSGTQRWKNSKTGEIYLAPAGYAPPSNDWVLDTQTAPNLLDTNTGVGVGGDGGPGGSAGAAGIGADGVGGTGSGVGGDNAKGGLIGLAMGGTAGGQYNLGSYSDGGRLLRGPGDGVSDSIPATIGRGQPARLADGEFVVPARIVSELGNGSTEAGARKLYAMMDRVQRARGKTTGKKKVATNTRAERFLPA